MNNIQKVTDQLMKKAEDLPTPPLIVELASLPDQELLEFKEYPTIKIGFPKIDHVGIPSGFILLSGVPGSGKSWFVNHLIYYAWKLNQKRSVFFTLEMDTKGLKKRMLQSYSGLSPDRFFSGDKTPSINFIREAKPIIVDYTQGDSDSITPESFTQTVHDYYSNGYRIFLFDHFHEVPGASTNDKNQQVSEIWGNAFKAIRNIYDDVWLFVLAQPTKEGGKSKEPLTKYSVSGSSALVNKMDMYISLNREENKEKDAGYNINDPKKILLWVDKNRRGIADKFGFNIELDNTGNFSDPGDSQASEIVGKTGQESIMDDEEDETDSQIPF